MVDFAESWEDTWVNINGEFVRGPDATVSVLEWSFVYGDGIFEGVSVVDGKILKLDRHVDRLYRSATRVGIDVPIPKEEMAERWIETARKNDIETGYVRPLVSRGEGPLGIHNQDRLDGPNVYVIPQLHRESGLVNLDTARARISSIRSPSPVVRDPRVKANQYLPNILAVDELAGTEADIPIRLDDDGYVTEAAAGNVFVVDGGALSTPPEQRILAGTTRAALIEYVDAHDERDVEIANLTPYDLYTAEECFVTGSTSGIKAITHLNSRPIGAGDAGPITRELNERLRDYLLENGTPIE